MGKQQFRLTIKGQVTIPKDVRDFLALRAGEPVAFEKEGGRVFVRKGDELSKDVDARRADMCERIRRARRHALPMDMTTDEYMAELREPVPIPDGQV